MAIRKPGSNNSIMMTSTHKVIFVHNYDYTLCMYAEWIHVVTVCGCVGIIMGTVLAMRPKMSVLLDVSFTLIIITTATLRNHASSTFPLIAYFVLSIWDV